MLVAFFTVVAHRRSRSPAVLTRGPMDTITIDWGDSAIIGIDATATPDDIVFDNDTALVRRHRVVM
jgi:hypothetical protein